jgi:hypothetical protein
LLPRKRGPQPRSSSGRQRKQKRRLKKPSWMLRERKNWPGLSKPCSTLNRRRLKLKSDLRRSGLKRKWLMPNLRVSTMTSMRPKVE